MESVYKNTLEEHRVLQTNLDDAQAEKEDALQRLRDLRRELDNRKSDRTDNILRSEIDRLRDELCVTLSIMVGSTLTDKFHIDKRARITSMLLKPSSTNITVSWKIYSIRLTNYKYARMRRRNSRTR